MRISAKLGLTALLAAMLLSAAIGTASARNLSVSNENIRVTWRRLEFSGGGAVVRCRVTLEGRFHARTIVKSRGSLIGSITRADVDKANCTGGQALAKNTPWHITYEGFTGTLPTINTVRLLLARFRFLLILPGLATCEYGTSTDNVVGTAAVSGGEITSLEPLAGSNIAHLEEPHTFFCPAEGTLTNEAGDRGVVTLLGTTTRIRVTLI